MEAAAVLTKVTLRTVVDAIAAKTMTVGREVLPADDGFVTLAQRLFEPLLALLAGIWAVQEQDAALLDEGDHGPQLPHANVWAGDVSGRVHRDFAGTIDEVRAMLEDGESKRHWRVVEMLGPNYPLGSPGRAYSLACYYAVQSAPEAQARALSLLATAVVDPSLRAWAPDDPWLTQIRTSDAWIRLFPDEKSKDTSAANPSAKALLDELKAFLCGSEDEK